MINRTARKYKEEKMREIIASEPDLYLYEIAAKFDDGTTAGAADARKSRQAFWFETVSFLRLV